MNECQMYKHNHKSLIIEDHHVIPKSWFEAAGVLVDTPHVQLCPTCHMNTHYAMDQILTGRMVGMSLVPLRAVALARTGLELGRAAGLTPRVTL